MHYKTEIGQTLKIILSLIQWNINEDLILQCIISAKIFQKIMHHTIQTKFTDQTTVIMKLKPMHVILYQKKKKN